MGARWMGDDVRVMDLVNAVEMRKVATTNVFICNEGCTKDVIRQWKLRGGDEETLLSREIG
jgi:hypothetical protein